MTKEGNGKSVLVIPCSGIGKVHGLISREATYLVTDELAPGKADTLCLALLVKGDPEAVAAVRNHACITLDGCAKACAEKNVQMAGGRVSKAFQVAASFKNHRGAQPGNASGLTDDGWAITREIAASAAAATARLFSGEEVIR